MDPCAFDKLFTKSVPHILEKIFFSLDFKSFNTCMDVSKTWRDLLTSDTYRAKGRLVFHNELFLAGLFLLEEKKLREVIEKIFLSLDWKSFKTCLDVSKTWREVLTSDSYRAKVKLVFHNELVKEQKLLREAMRPMARPLAYFRWR